MPTCFLLAQHMSLRPLINKNTIKRHYHQGSYNEEIIAFPQNSEESMKPTKPTVWMLPKGYGTRATNEQPPEQNLKQLMKLSSSRQRKLTSVYPKTTLESPPLTEQKPTGKRHPLNLKQPEGSFTHGFLHEKAFNPHKVGTTTEASRVTQHQYQNSPLLVTTFKNQDEDDVDEDTVVKASFSASLTTSPDALLKTIRDICKSLLNIFLSGFFLD